MVGMCLSILQSYSRTIWSTIIKMIEINPKIYLSLCKLSEESSSHSVSNCFMLKVKTCLTPQTTCENHIVVDGN